MKPRDSRITWLWSNKNDQVILFVQKLQVKSQLKRDWPRRTCPEIFVGNGMLYGGFGSVFLKTKDLELNELN